MGTRIMREGTDRVYGAAQKWVDAVLCADSSLFTPGHEVWAPDCLGELRARYLDNPDRSQRDFMAKLQDQLAGSPPAVYQLLAEALFFHHLITSTQNPARKWNRIEMVLQWSPTPVPIPDSLGLALSPGLVHPGQYFHRKRPFQVGFIIEFVEQWKNLRSAQQEHLLGDPWAFKAFNMGIQPVSRMLREEPSSYRAQREALNHLTFPDTFEAIVSVAHKQLIAKAFSKRVPTPAQDLDRLLQQIRPEVETLYGAGDHLFYQPAVRDEWDPNYQASGWRALVDAARPYHAALDLEIHQLSPKRETGRRLSQARQAVLAGADKWAELVVQGCHDTHWVEHEAREFWQWLEADPQTALNALRSLWTADPVSPAERVQAFLGLLPPSVLGGPGRRTALASILLMGLDAEQYPPYRWTLMERAYDRTGYDGPEEGASGANHYDCMLQFLDRFIQVAYQQNLPLASRLEAQSLVWLVENPPPPPKPGVNELAEELLCEPSWLH